MNKTCKEMPLTIVYTPISYGKLRLWANMKESLNMLTKLGRSFLVIIREVLLMFQYLGSIQLGFARAGIKCRNPLKPV